MEDDLKNQGYSKEEEYFHKLNQDLIEKLKEKKEASEKSGDETKEE